MKIEQGRAINWLFILGWGSYIIILVLGLCLLFLYLAFFCVALILL